MGEKIGSRTDKVYKTTRRINDSLIDIIKSIKNQSLSETLLSFKEPCCHVVKRYGLSTDTVNLKCDIQAKKKYPTMAEYPRDLDYAIRILKDIKCIEAHINSGDVEKAALEGITLGRHVEMYRSELAASSRDKKKPILMLKARMDAREILKARMKEIAVEGYGDRFLARPQIHDVFNLLKEKFPEYENYTNRRLNPIAKEIGIKRPIN